MQARWFSRRGNERAQNSDAAAVGQQGQNVLVVLVDGAEKGPRGAELARHWADVALQALVEAPSGSPATILARLKYEQAQLRYSFLHDVASYCIVSFDSETLTAEIWHCGDCRIGLRHQTETRWLTIPHILAQQPGIPSPRTSVERERHEQLLTRCLSARRFIAPDYKTLTLQQGQTLLLCTDGYWQEHLEAGISTHQLRDDGSLITLPVGLGGVDNIELDTDADNLKRLQGE